MKEDDQRVWYDEMSAEFVGEKIERGNITAEVVAVIATSDTPNDESARYSLEVRAYSDDGDRNGRRPA
jgi:hypothetical protein